MLVRLFLRRLVLSGFTMVLVSMLIFGALEILPGDVASRNLGRFATEEQKAEFRQKMHLDLPVEKRYLNWIGHVIQGDFGRSLSSDRPVAAIIGPRLRNTLMLATFSFLLSLPITFLLAVISAMTRVELARQRDLGFHLGWAFNARIPYGHDCSHHVSSAIAIVSDHVNTRKCYESSRLFANCGPPCDDLGHCHVGLWHPHAPGQLD